MKIMHIISSGGMYGAEAVILNISRLLNEATQNTTSCIAVFTSGSQRNIELRAAAESQGAEIHPLFCSGPFDYTIPRKIRALVQGLRVDVVHAHGYKADIYSWIALGRTNTPLVSTCHTWYDNDWTVRAYGTLDRLLLKAYDEVVAVSSEVRRRLLQSGVRPERVSIIANGIDSSLFTRGSTLLAHTEPHVGLVGRLAPEKGCDLFIRAAAEVLPTFPTSTFSIAGDGPDRLALQNLIQQLGVQKKVFLRGRVDDMPTFYNSLDLLVSSSRREGLPIALLEGMAASLPVVATRVGEVASLVVDNVTGRLVPAENIPALASALATLLEDESLRRALGAAGRQRVATLYSSERMTADYLNVYERAIAGRLAQTQRGAH